MNSETLKSTALTQVHIDLGAKMVPFAGYNMPVQYSNLNEEHLCVREKVGLFDVSHMGEFWVEGPGAMELIQKLTSNDVSKLFDGKVQYSCLPNDKGGIVDDLLVYRFSEEKYLLVVNASNIEKDWNWITSYNTNGVQLTDASDDYSLLAVQGPKATEALQKLTEENLGEMGYYTFKVGELAGVSDVIISATGYTGAGGFELYIKNSDAKAIWDAVFEAGKEFGIQPAGLGARDTLRLEKGFCLYGNDINDETSPIEAGLGWITKFSNEFTHSEYHKKLKEEGVKRRLVGFVMQERGIPRQHYPLLNEAGERIGEVTSGTQSPSLGKAIGMGYVLKEFSAVETRVFVEIRNKAIPAEVTKIPFL